MSTSTTDNRPETAAASAPQRTGTAFFVAGIALLGVCVVATGALVLQHLVGLAVPGCGGAASPCAQAAASVWGKVPLVGWPVSFVGLAYFGAALVGWGLGRGRVLRGFANLVRLGAVASVGFVVVMFAGSYVCPYCLAAHGANVAFWLVVEQTARSQGAVATSWRPLGAVGLIFVLATAALGVADLAQKGRVREKEERELVQSTQEIIAHSQDGPAFTGRYRVGPEAAPIRLVIFSDYQCEDCASIEDDIFELFEERDDMSISVKHFPFSQDCNPYTDNRHPNACWAARAAETAGILRGEEAFWEMHHWLFDRGGGFTRDELLEYTLEQGYDTNEWSTIMGGPETLRRVKDDIGEAADLGIKQTPLIYINGVELKGWRALNGVRRAVEALAATNPPALSAAADKPRTKAEIAFDVWRTLPRTTLPADSHPWAAGSETADVDVVIWGDYQEPFTAEADAIVRNFMSGRSNVRYHFRHYPIDKSCNPVTKSSKHPKACMAAKAAEAAGMLGGVEGYGKMHVWLMENLEGFSEATLEQAVVDLGFDPDAFRAAFESAEAEAAIREDCLAGKGTGLRFVPWIYVDGKFIQRWRFVTTQLLTRILEQAEQE